MGFQLTKDNISSKMDRRKRQNVRGTRASSSNLKTNDQAYRRLRKLGYVSETTQSTTDTGLALEILNTIGCSLSTEPIDMSLLTEQTDTESIDNENIIDEVSFSKTKNAKKSSIDKFTNLDDPFYTLDSAIETTLSIEKQSINSQPTLQTLENLTADVVTKNLDSSSSTLKQFNFSN